MAAALSGVVSKAVLFVRPKYAQERELLSLVKFKLFEAGFIIIHEEYRRINDEMADTIAVQLDRAAFLSGSATPMDPTESTRTQHPMFMRENATTVPTGPQELVGHVHFYVVARRECHAELLRFLDHLFADSDFKAVVMSIEKKTAHDDASTKAVRKEQEGESEGDGKAERSSISCPLFCNAAAVAAKQVVQLLFPRMLVQDVPTTAASREYVQAELKGALLPALVELSKAKPENPIRWLAERLLNTNTRAPPLISAATLNGKN